MLPWIIQLASGAIGGNVFGKLFKNFSLGTLGNSLAGILGGGLGGQLLGMLGVVQAGDGAEGGLDLGAVLAQVGAGGAGGGVLMTVIGMVKQALGKSSS